MTTKIITECEPGDLEDQIRRNIKACIAHADLSHSDIAARMGCTPAYISSLLSGKKTMSLRSVVAMALAAGWVPSFELIDRTEPPA